MKRRKDIVLIYALFIAIFRPYFLPDTIRKILKLGIIVSVFLFCFFNVKKKSKANISLVYGMAIIISSFIAYRDNYISMSALFDALYYSICLYTIVLTFVYFYEKKRTEDLAIGVLDISSVYVVLTLISLIHPLYVDNSGLATYLFGNKFSSSYFFLLNIASFYSVYSNKIRKNKVYEMLYFSLVFLSLFFSYVTECSTTIVASLLFIILFFLNEKTRRLLMNPFSAMVGVGVSAAFPSVMSIILGNKYVQFIVVNVLGESTNLNYRNIIYNNHLFYLLQNRFMFGYGYNNTAMLDRTNQVFSNAQNGILEVMLKYGLLGIVAIVVTIFICYKRSKKTHKVEGFSYLVYVLLFAGMIEVTINWFMMWAIFLVRWVDSDKETVKNTVVFSEQKRRKRIFDRRKTIVHFDS